MKKTMILTGAMLAGALFGGVVHASCSIHEHRDFQGASGVVQNNHYLRFATKSSPQDRHLPARKNATYWDPSWYNKVSSVQLTDGCKAVFFMTPGNTLTGHQVLSETTAMFPEGLNDKTTGMICECP